MLPAIVGGLASLMADLNKDIREYRAKFSELRLSMQRQKLNQPLQHALLQYHNYIWTRQNGADDPAVALDGIGVRAAQRADLRGPVAAHGLGALQMEHLDRRGE